MAISRLPGFFFIFYGMYIYIYINMIYIYMINGTIMNSH